MVWGKIGDAEIHRELKLVRWHGLSLCRCAGVWCWAAQLRPVSDVRNSREICGRPPGDFKATIALDSRLDRKVSHFIQQDHRMFVDGKFVKAASGKSFPVYNPATGEVMAHVPEAEAVDVDRAVRAARKAFDEGPWPKMSPSARGKLIWKLGD